MQIIATHSIWQQPSLVPTPHKFSAPFLAIYKQIVQDNSDLNKSLKKQNKTKRGKNAFLIQFWNPRELWDRTLFFLALYQIIM